MDRRTLERARDSRDPRFDGRFFVATPSSGVYCRPICPSPPPSRGNVRYFETATAAAEAGFRPCRRCRSDVLPGTPAWQGTSAIVARALRLVDDGYLDTSSVESLAETVGIGPRHLHRLFVQHIGVAPAIAARTRRAERARRLVDETDISMSEVALSAGFSSLRRFNDAFRMTYGCAPGERRKLRRRGVEPAGEVVLRLPYRPPYAWTRLLAFLRDRAVDGVERVDEASYARTVETAGGAARVTVRALEHADALEARVRGAAPADLLLISRTLRRVFDLAANPSSIAAGLAGEPVVAGTPALAGLRIPGVWDPVECAVRAALGEGLFSDARRLLCRMVARAGQPVRDPEPGLTRLFPSARVLAAAADGLGLPAHAARPLRSLVTAIVEGSLDLRSSVEAVRRGLSSLGGWKPSSAEYVALRGMGDPDAFPVGDSTLQRRAEACRPWRGYAAVRLAQVGEDLQRSGIA